MKRKDILNTISWILLIIVIILVLWRILGNSPSDLLILASLFTILLKMWAISDELKDLKHEVKYSFIKAKEDIDNIKSRFIKSK